MARIRSDFTIIRGDTSSIEFRFTQSGAAGDLTGGEVFFTAKSVQDTADDSGAAISVTVSSFSDPTTGICTIPLSHTDTNVTPGDYFYDIQVKKADGSIVSIPARKFTIEADVTRRII